MLPQFDEESARLRPRERKTGNQFDSINIALARIVKIFLFYILIKDKICVISIVNKLVLIKFTEMFALPVLQRKCKE